MSPTIQSGDRVIIDTDHRVPSPDGLYAIRDRFGSIVVKRLQVLRRGDPPIVKIISDNPHHGEEEVSAEEIETAIIGRVLWGLKRL
jgi:phage repressor protein C with HTH and peptisase S24 domain